MYLCYNIKIVAVTETKDEALVKKVPQILNDIAKSEIDPKSDIIAMHWISGKQGLTRPIIVKLNNTEVTAKILRKKEWV